MKKPYLIFLVVAVLMNAFLYFYPADIFQAEVIDGLKFDTTLKDLFSKKSGADFTNLTLKGWFMLVICTVGIPGIIAWRTTLTKYGRKSGEEEKSIYDKLK
jgi:hypothetical protein